MNAEPKMRNVARLRTTTSHLAIVALMAATLPAGASIDNTAIVNGTLPNGNPVYAPGSEPSDDVSVDVAPATPNYVATKTAVFNDDGDNDGIPEVGETMTFRVTLVNTGNVTLTPAALSDPGPAFNGGSNQSVSVPAVGSPTSESGTVNGLLDVGETIYYDISYTLTQADIDAAAGVTDGVQNTASVTVNDPDSNPVTADPSSNLTATATLAIAPGLTLDKEAYDAVYPGGAVEAGPVSAGDTIYYRFLVTNTGNVTISGVAIDEDAAFNGTNGSLGDPVLVGGSTSTPTGGTTADLAPGETAIFEIAYSVNQTDVDTLQ